MSTLLGHFHTEGEVFWEECEETGRFSSTTPAEALARQTGVTSDEYGRATLMRGSCPQRVNGARALNARRAQDLVTLEQGWGGWHKGHRHQRLSLYAQFLRGAGRNNMTAMEALVIMAKNCNPPYPSDANDPKLSAIIEHEFQGEFKKLTTQTLVAWLGITSEEAREWELTTLIPPEVINERKLPKGGEREANRVQRQAWIKEYVSTHGMCSCRKLVETLAQAGITTNRQTVNQDLQGLGCFYLTPRKKAGRPGKEQLSFESRPDDSANEPGE